MIGAGLPWPSWEQGLGLAVVSAALAFVLRRLRPTRATEVAIPVVTELGILSALYALWQSAKKLPLEQADGAIDRARTIIDVQDALFLPSELGVNELAVRNDWLGWLSSAYYAGMHVPSIVALLIWMFWRHRDRYSLWRNVLALTTAGCIVIRFWRVAPPRFLPELGFVDVTVIHGMDVYGPVGQGLSGQFVAMPSIHVAWAGVIAVAVMTVSPSRWRWVAAAHLPITVFVVSATGHHWWLDGIVALALIVVAWVVVGLVDRSIRRAPPEDQLDRSTPTGSGAVDARSRSTSATNSPIT
ncbi:MAG: phosphatase PAP2 family protein [Actinomycetota bacterium]